MTDLLFNLRQDIISESQGRIHYIGKAFDLLPKIFVPNILDVGCGSGIVSLELARLSGGVVTGVDNHQPSLNLLKSKAEANGYAHRIQTICDSMQSMDFEKDFFDIIWAEGSIHIIGFEQGLRKWRRFLKSGGFLVIHEMVWLLPDPPVEIRDYWIKRNPEIDEVPVLIDKISDCGYGLINHFALPENFWWQEYYSPLEKRIWRFREEETQDTLTLEMLDQELFEIDLYKKHHHWFGSAFFILQKAE